MDNNPTMENKIVTIHTEALEGNNLLKNVKQGPPSLLKSEDNPNQKSELVICDEKSTIKQSFHSMLSQTIPNEQQNIKQNFQKSVVNDHTIMQQMNIEEQIRQQDMNISSFSPPPNKPHKKSNAFIYNSSQKENEIMLKDISGIQFPNLVQNLETELRHQSSGQKSQIKTSMNLSIIVKLIKAVKLFKSFLTPKKLHQKQARIIHDLSFYDASETQHKKKKPNSLKHAYKKFIMFSKKQNQLSTICSKIKDELKDFIESLFKFLDQKFPVIEAFNPFKVLFDIFKIMVTTFAIFLNTVEVCFDLNFDDIYPSVIFKIRYIIIGFYTLCIFLSLNTAISSKGMIEHRRKEILILYVSNRLISDALAIISFIRFYDLQRVGRDIIKLFILAQDHSHSNKNHKLVYIIRLIKLLLIIILVAHFVAVAFYGQTLLFEYESQVNWVNSSNVVSIHDQWYIKYIFALYFSVTTMMTVGYGDITPRNSYEAVLCIISMVIACGVFAYSFNLIGLIISDMNKKDRQFKKKINKVNLYLTDRNIDDELKTKVQKFYEYKFKHHKTLRKKDEEIILQELSPYLLEKIVFQTKQKIINNDKKIFQRFSDQFKNQVCLKLKEIHVNKDEVLFEQGMRQDDPQMYFIHKGCIEIYYRNKYNQEGVSLKFLSNGQIFGENSFFLNQERTANARAVESSILYSLSRSDFLDQISYFTAEKEKYHFIINNMMFRQSNTIISESCYYCHSEKHSIYSFSTTAQQFNLFYSMIKVIKNCPRLHYQPDRELVILKNNYPEPHIEREYFRRKRRKESGYSVLIISKQYQLDEPIGIQKENLEFLENKQELIDKNDLHSDTSTDEKSSESKSEKKGPIKILSTLKTIVQENSQKTSPKFTETFLYFPQDEQTLNKELSFQTQLKTMQFQDTLKEQQSTNNPFSIKSTAESNQMLLTQGGGRMAQRQQQYYTHQNQFKNPLSAKQIQENQMQAIQKAKEQFKIPKMSFNDEVLNTSDISLGEIDEHNRSPINQVPKSMPASRKQSLFKRIIPHVNKRSSSKEFHYSDTIRDLVKFKEKFQESHQKIGKGGMSVSARIQRKSILKANTTKPNKDQLEVIKKIVEQNHEEEEAEVVDISDKMKSYKYFYPNFNYQKVIQHLNMLRTIQNCKFPSYFNVYSICNRKNQALRIQAIKVQQSKLKFN